MNEHTEVGKVQATPLPVTREDLLAHRKVLKIPTLNDSVEVVVLRIWEDPQYQRLVKAVTNSEAVEGSLSDDDVAAAGYLREFAKANGVDDVGKANTKAIRTAMGVVLRRYGQSREQRRFIVSGETAPADPVHDAHDEE